MRFIAGSSVTTGLWTAGYLGIASAPARPLSPASRGQPRPVPAELQTERLSLEPLRTAHAPWLIEPLRDPRLYRFLPDIPVSSLRELRARFDWLATGSSPDGLETWFHWAAYCREERRHVGLFEATLHERRWAEIGYLIFPSAWRRGYALEACRRIVQHLFAERAVDLVVADTMLANIAARRLAEQLGFREASCDSRSDSCFKCGGPPAGHVRYVLEAGAPAPPLATAAGAA